MSSKTSPSSFDRRHPLLTTIKERVLLTKPGSTKQTFHIALNASATTLSYRVGDSIGICPQNDPILVHHLLSSLQASGEERIVDKRTNHPMSIRDFLLYKANLARVTSSFLHLFYQYETSSHKRKSLEEWLSPERKKELSHYLADKDPLSLFQEYKNQTIPLQDVCDQFGPLLPRFYSIASSPLYSSDQIDLTVALFTFSYHGEIRYGVASHFLCSLAQPGIDPIPIYIQPSPHFGLPDNPAAPIILVGPGTGVAPFRAFLQERIHSNAPGKNWLFFGERNRATDYLYEEELETYQKEGNLVLDLAFSRDQREKIYVQDLLLRKGAQVWDWLEQGAYFYVCGDAEQMAKGVDLALHTLCQKEGNLSEEQAHRYVKELRAQKRYLTDVY